MKKSILVLLSTVSSLVGLVALRVYALETELLIPRDFPLISSETHADIGFIFRNGDALNRATFKAINYVGECPGYEEVKLRGWFQDPEVDTLKKRKVRIINLSHEGRTNKLPYENKDYDNKDGRSNRISFSRGLKHRSSRLVVLKGTNLFSYIIYEGKYGKDNFNMIKEGSFTAFFDHIEIDRRRDIEWENTPRFVCVDNDGAITLLDKSNCKDTPTPSFPATQRVGDCGGKSVYGKVKFLSD